MQQEEDSKSGNNNRHTPVSNSCDEDELIDMEMDEYPSDEEHDSIHWIFTCLSKMQSDMYLPIKHNNSQLN